MDVDALIAPSAGTRRCTGCSTSKPWDEFPFKNRATGRRHARCKTCVRAASRDHHAQVKDDVNPKIKARRLQTAEDNRLRVAAALTARGCDGGCGQHDPARLSVRVTDGGKPVGRRVRDGTSWDNVSAAVTSGQVWCRRCRPPLLEAA